MLSSSQLRDRATRNSKPFNHTPRKKVYPKHAPLQLKGVEYEIVENKFGFHAVLNGVRMTGNLKNKELVRSQLEQQ